jgi:hypothetical protein
MDVSPFERILVCWKVSGPSGGQVVCELGRTADGLELRSSRRGDAILRTERVRNITEAFDLAARWKTAYAPQGGAVSTPELARPRPSSGPRTILEQRARYRHGGDLRRLPD